MKRVLIYIALLLAAMLLPMRGMDVGKLRPVGLLQLYKEEGNVIIVTDTGDSGRGNTVDAAFRNLEETTAGVIYLDTADYLLLSKTATDAIKGLEKYLKPTIGICYAEKGIDPVQAAEYLAVHHLKSAMKDKSVLETAWTLSVENGRLVLK